MYVFSFYEISILVEWLSLRLMTYYSDFVSELPVVEWLISWQWFLCTRMLETEATCGWVVELFPVIIEWGSPLGMLLVSFYWISFVVEWLSLQWTANCSDFVSELSVVEWFISGQWYQWMKHCGWVVDLQCDNRLHHMSFCCVSMIVVEWMSLWTTNNSSDFVPKLTCGWVVDGPEQWY